MATSPLSPLPGRPYPSLLCSFSVPGFTEGPSWPLILSSSASRRGCPRRCPHLSDPVHLLPCFSCLPSLWSASFPRAGLCGTPGSAGLPREGLLQGLVSGLRGLWGAGLHVAPGWSPEVPLVVATLLPAVGRGLQSRLSLPHTPFLGSPRAWPARPSRACGLDGHQHTLQQGVELVTMEPAHPPLAHPTSSVVSAGRGWNVGRPRESEDWGAVEEPNKRRSFSCL